MKTNKEIVCSFIESVWNAQQFQKINDFVSDQYRDHSFLPVVPPTRDGLKLWIQNTSVAFRHKTTIESVVEEADQVAVRITFEVAHIGTWRNIPPTGRTTSVKGFRFFRLENQKITEHWALIDGEALQTALTDTYHGCEIPSKQPS
jgi:predicted ester cyclase